MYSG
ncbi:CPXV205 protein, partial [Monkeypox virus]